MSLSIVPVSAASAAINTIALYKQANGEYSAGSVAGDYSEATKLGLIKLQDGNYGSLLSTVFASSPAAATSSPGIQSALNSFVLGG